MKNEKLRKGSALTRFLYRRGRPVCRPVFKEKCSRAGCLHPAVYPFVYLAFFLPSEYLCTPSVEENAIQLPFSTVTSLSKNKFFGKVSRAVQNELHGFSYAVFTLSLLISIYSVACSNASLHLSLIVILSPS